MNHLFCSPCVDHTNDSDNTGDGGAIVNLAFIWENVEGEIFNILGDLVPFISFN